MVVIKTIFYQQIFRLVHHYRHLQVHLHHLFLRKIINKKKCVFLFVHLLNIRKHIVHLHLVYLNVQIKIRFFFLLFLLVRAVTLASRYLIQSYGMFSVYLLENDYFFFRMWKIESNTFESC